MGCGKSCACKSMERRGHKVLLVFPTNRLAKGLEKGDYAHW